MGMPNISTLLITPKILARISELDEFKGAWRALGTLAPERLSSLRRSSSQSSGPALVSKTEADQTIGLDQPSAPHAAGQSLNEGLRIAFRSGAVMGLNVVGFALLDISFWFYILNSHGEALGLSGGPAERLAEMTTVMLSFGMGASTQALFARVGGGIYTKAADVGADLVGKVEAGIPEDDPRNPGVIADNVGDNVGDVAGMGSDIFESYCGAQIATIAIAATSIAIKSVSISAEPRARAPRVHLAWR